MMEDGYQTTISGQEFMEMITGKRGEGKPPQKNNELYKNRVRVAFDFDITIDSSAIIRSGLEDATNQLDLALLEKFVSMNDKAKLRELFADKIALTLDTQGHENFFKWMVGYASPELFERHLFSDAIHAMKGPMGKQWQSILDTPVEVKPHNVWDDSIQICTEQILECVEAEFVAGHLVFAGKP